MIEVEKILPSDKRELMTAQRERNHSAGDGHIERCRRFLNDK